MRNRKYLIGVLVGVVGALAFSGVASAAAPTSQELETTLSPAKGDPKEYFGVSLHNIIRTNYPDFVASPSPQQTVFTIDPNVKFTNGNLTACPLSSITGRPTATARAACPQSITGQGTVQANNGAIQGVVTFFTGGPNVIYVHTDLASGALIIPIQGIISGKTLTFSGIPNTPGTSLTLFDTTFNKIGVGKKKGVKQFYVSARCKTGKWSTSETTTFYNGQQLSASSSQSCKKKKKKKK
jgi:hypothetical protein